MSTTRHTKLGSKATSGPELTKKPAKRSALKPLQKKKVVTILLIGETGTGKTSFMSLLLNLLQGNGPFELEEKHDTTKESGLSKTQSQTTEAALYITTTSDGVEIQILDTPGLADTRGIDQDNKHKAEINSAIKELVTSIDAVLIMANGTLERLGAATSYTLSVITSMFPRPIINNIGFIFTNSDPLTWNFQMDKLQPELRNAQCWLIQNPLALSKNYETQAKRGGPDAVMKKWRRTLTTCYEDTVETLNEWLEWLDERDVQPTKGINDLYQKLVSIESYLEAKLSALTRSHERRRTWESLKFDLEDTEKNKSALERLKIQQTAPVWDRQASSDVNTVCIQGGCYKNCHVPCGLSFKRDPTDLGKYCAAFLHDPPQPGRRDGSTLCVTCGHKAEQHRHYYHLHVEKPRPVDPATKRKLDEATTKEQRLRAARNAVDRELNLINAEMVDAQDQICRLVNEYNEISLSRNFAGHIRSAIHMLECRKVELQSNPDTGAELRLIDESIAKFEKKLQVLQEAKSSASRVFDMAKGVYRYVVPRGISGA